jgi:hypothetical protein
MTREEQIKEFAFKDSKEVLEKLMKDSPCNRIGHNDVSDIVLNHDLNAIKWADENPNWHCTADGDLPSIGMCVAVTNIKSNLRKVYIEYVDIDSDINYIRRNMTHWMEIKLPNNK